VRDDGFEVGVHAYDHVKWQDGVAQASLGWTREQLVLAAARFRCIFGFTPRVHGAAGWQVNAYVPTLQRMLGFEVASDTRGRDPFLPAGGVVQVPTTLPTLDELLGVRGARVDEAIRRLVERARAGDIRNHVFTLHAELEGGAFLASFESLLRTWQDEGFRFCTLGEQARALDRNSLQTAAIVRGEIEGRSGTLALQGGMAAS
jgi:peptidoglycan/xylan/chitin deacetylase (PgdA/CDA1 family)